MINIILVLGIAAFIFLSIGFKLDSKHDVFKFFSLFFAVFTLILISKAGIDSNTVCSFELNNTVYYNSTNTTNYNYSQYCYIDTTYEGTSKIFYGLAVAYMGLLFIYLIVFMFKLGGDYLNRI